MTERDEKSLIEKYGRRFFEDPERPGAVHYVVHTGVQWTDTGTRRQGRRRGPAR